MRYAIVIPTYNHCDDLLKPCVESIIANTNKSADIQVDLIIVANGCTDETHKYLNELNFRKDVLPFTLHIIWDNNPLGFTKATNLGIISSLELKSDYTILMNNDVVLMEFAKNNKWLDMLTAPFSDPAVGMTGTSKIIDPTTQAEFIIFYMAMIKTQLFWELGALDDRFNPGYGEDIDFSIRLQRAGYKISRVPSEGVGHTYKEFFPLYHGAEKTMHDDKSNIKSIFGLSWDEVVARNEEYLRDKYVNKDAIEKKKYSIIIPTTGDYKDKLDNCLHTLFDTLLSSGDNNAPKIEIIIIANGVTDDTLNYLSKLQSNYDIPLGVDLFIHTYETAIGFPKAINAGIAKSTGDYIVLLNDDVIFLNQPKNEWIDIMSAPFKYHDSRVGITGLKKLGSSFAKTDYLMFFCVMISRELINSMGVLDEEFTPAWVEDEEYCLRAQLANYQTVEMITDTPYEQRSVQIYHRSSATLNDFSEKRKIVKRNRYYLLNKYYPNDLVNFIVPTYNRHEELRRALESIERQTYDKIKVWVCADGHDNIVQNIVEEFNEVSEHKIFTYLSLPEHEGLLGSKPRMLGIDAIDSRGVVCFLDDDNIIYPQYTEKLFALLRSDNSYTNMGEYIPDSNVLSYCVINHSHSINPVPVNGHIQGLFEHGNIDTLNIMVQASVAKRCKAAWQHIASQKVTHDYDFIVACAAYGKSVFLNEILADHCMSLNKVQNNDTLIIPKKGKIYDCFQFYNELDVLDIRFNTLYDYVDKFVLVEARFTHQGNPKPLYFQENKDRYRKFADKIVHIVVEEMVPLDHEYIVSQKDKLHFKDGNQHWMRERYQRDMMVSAWTQCEDNDIIIISDADEIINPKTLQEYDISFGYCSLIQRLFYYKLNCEIMVPWDKARIMPYSFIKNKYPSDVRCDLDREVNGSIQNAGWHFSYLYSTAELVSDKIQSFCHAELNTADIIDVKRINTLIQNGQDLYGRDHKMSYKHIDDDYPQYVLNNQQMLTNRNLIKPIIYETSIDEYKAYNNDLFIEIFEANLYDLQPEDVLGKVVVDIGANVGFFAIQSIALGAEEVYAFEPQVDNYNKLQEFIKNIPQIKPHKLAVLDGIQKFINITNDGVCSTIWGTSDDEMVPCVSLEEVIDMIDSDADDMVLKLDCEGPEFDIIFSTPKHIMERFDTIFIEIHEKLNPKYLNKKKELQDYIQSLGYEQQPQLLSTGTWYDDGSFVAGENNVFKYKRRAITSAIDHEVMKQLEPFIFSEIYTDNVYGIEKKDIENTTVIDIGANYGFFSIRALELGAKNCYCFEPEGANYNQLAKLTANNPKIKTFKVAVSDGAVSEIHMHSDTVASNIWGNDNGEAVKCISFVEAMSYVDAKDNNLILKMDCEGSEYEILLNTPAEIIQKFNRIYVEIHDEMNPNYQHKSQMLLDYLQFLGFTVESKGPQWGTWYADGSFKAYPIYVYKIKRTSAPWNTAQIKPRVYDCFMFNDELDVLDIRLAELDEVVDYFVIVESHLTHSGKSKPLYFKDNAERYQKYAHKIRHIVFDEMPQTNNAWHRESHQRDACMRGLYDCEDYDIIISGDADEIPRKEIIQNYNPSVGVLGVETKYYFYFLNCERQDKGTTHLRIIPYYILKPYSFCFFRYKDYSIIKNGGWHFSFIGDVAQIQKKIDSYAHQEYNTDYYTNTERLTKIINAGGDILEKNMSFNFVDINDNFPKYVIEHKELFEQKNLIKHAKN